MLRLIIARRFLSSTTVFRDARKDQRKDLLQRYFGNNLYPSMPEPYQTVTKDQFQRDNADIAANQHCTDRTYSLCG